MSALTAMHASSYTPRVMSVWARVTAGTVAGLLFLLTVGAAASTRPDRLTMNGGTLVVGMSMGDPGNLDPSLSTSFAAAEVYKAMCERLYDYDLSLRLVPELADAMPTISKDRLTYTIPLRRGVRFNDGTPLRAQAVVTTIERDLTIPGASRRVNLSPIAGIAASSPYTVVIHLRARYTPLTKELASADGVIMSPSQLAKLGDNFGTNPVCAGPFMFDSRVPGDTVTVVKSPYYYDRKDVHLDKIVFKSEPNAAAAIAALKAGDLQVLDSVPPAELPAVENNTRLRVLAAKSLGYVAVYVNMGNTHGVGNLPYSTATNPLASSAKLRQAFEEAIDRKTMSWVVFQGRALPGCTFISPVSPAFDASIHCTPFDPAAAAKLVAASGIPNPTVHLLTSNATDSTLLAQFIQAEEAAVGIKVVIDSIDQTTVFARIGSGDFDAWLGSWSGSPDTDRNVFQMLSASGSRNYSGYSSPRLDLILANARKATRHKAIATLYHAAQQVILADRPIIYLYHPIVYAAVAANLTGVQLPFDTLLRAAFAQYR
jgi:peptide/nickel transport system substrate-binding protein